MGEHGRRRALAARAFLAGHNLIQWRRSCLAMTINTPRALFVLALSACTCLSVLVGACTIDEPATYLPRAGTWTYEELSVVSNSCGDGVALPDPLTTFLLDYDEDDEFQIELGAEDVVCEIDGTEFTCGAYEAFESGIPGTDAIVRITVQWSGEFSSETVADGHEVTSVTCTGEDCAGLDAFPCSRDTTFAAEFLN
jgi:hypothetical protein